MITGYEHYKDRKWVSFSSLTNFKRCPRRMFYSSGCGLETYDAKPALLFGESLHAALPWVVSPSDGDLKKSIEEFDKIWDESIADKKRSRSRALSILVDFQGCHTRGRSLYTLVDPAELLDVNKLPPINRVSPWELPFAIDIGLDVPLVGRVDGIARHRDTGKLWALEWKTASNMWNYFDAFQLNNQVVMAKLALELTSGQKIEGTILEAIQVDAVKTGSQPNPISVMDHQVDAFLKWAKWQGLQMLECERQKDFPPDYSGCHPYSAFGVHGFKCDYLNLCQHTPDWTTNKDLYKISTREGFSLPVL